MPVDFPVGVGDSENPGYNNDKSRSEELKRPSLRVHHNAGRFPTLTPTRPESHKL
jgi:hypothetical protein